MRPDSGRSNGRERSLRRRLRVGVDLGLQRRLKRLVGVARADDEVGSVLPVLAAPDELRVEVAVAPLVRDLDAALFGPVHYGP